MKISIYFKVQNSSYTGVWGKEPLIVKRGGSLIVRGGGSLIVKGGGSLIVKGGGYS